MGKYAEVENMLRKYAEIDHKIYRLIKHRKTLLLLMDEVSEIIAQRISGMPKGSQVDTIYNLYILKNEKYAEELKELEQQIEALEQEKKRIDTMINNLEEFQISIIRWKYIDKLPEMAILFNLKKINYPMSRQNYATFILPSILKRINNELEKEI